MNRESSRASAQKAFRQTRTLKRLLRRFRPVRWAAAGALSILLVKTTLEILQPYLIGETIGTLEKLEGTGIAVPDSFWRLFTVLAVVLVSKSIAFYASQVAAARVGQDLENSFRADLFRHVLALRFRYHDENRSGETIARSLRDMQKARYFFREVWFGYLEIGLLVLGVVGVCYWTHWSYGALVTAIFGVAIACTVWAGGHIGRIDRRVSDHYDDVATTLQENVAGARIVRAFGKEPQQTAKFGGRMDPFTGEWDQLTQFWTTYMPWIGHLYHLALPLVLVLGVLRFAAGTGSLAEVVAVLLYIRTVHHRIRPLTRLVRMGQEAVASASRVYEVLDRAEVIRTPAEPRSLPAEGGELRIEDVHFAHGPDAPVLRGVSLRVRAGESVGIVGPTGSGKSTLVQLLPRFYDPDRGRILLDGIDIRDLDVHELRAAVGLVFQEPFLFSETVADNIAYGRPGVSREEIEECARLAAAHEFVTALPQGYETVVGERGVSLSGGQRQRLTIARALAMDPRVLAFDDATASVDAVTEKRLFDGIRSAARGRTTLVISQRVTSVRWCDRIAVLEGGRITAVGTHEELVGTSELYGEILRHQELKGVMP